MVFLAVSMITIIVIVFFVLVAYMQKVFKSEVSSATTHLDNLAAEYAQKEEAIKKQFEEAKRQSQEIIENAKKDAEQQKANILKLAQEEEVKLITQAQEKAGEIVQQADNARLALLAEVEDKINEKAVQKAMQFLQAALPEHIRENVHQRWVDDLVATSFEGLERLKVPEGTNEVKLVSAFKLDPKQMQALRAKLKEKLGTDLKINEEIDPGIIAGLVVNVGSLFFDGSLKFKIQEAARGQQQAGGK